MYQSNQYLKVEIWLKKINDLIIHTLTDAPKGIQTPNLLPNTTVQEAPTPLD